MAPAFALGTAVGARAAPTSAVCAPRRRGRVVVKAELLNPADSGKEMKQIVEVGVGKKMPVCRCWRSKKFPMCDGSHNAYNKESGDNVGPLVISVPKGE